jgi:hypothetical protein
MCTPVLNPVPRRKLRPRRPRQKAKACVLSATSLQVRTAAGGSGGQASHRGAVFSPEEDLATLEGKVRASNNALIGARKRKRPRGVPLEERTPFSSRGAFANNTAEEIVPNGWRRHFGADTLV